MKIEAGALAGSTVHIHGEDVKECVKYGKLLADKVKGLGDELRWLSGDA